MIDRAELLNDCKGLMRTLEEDLVARSHGDTALPEAVETLKEEFRKAKDAKRTAQNFEDWRTDYATQQAAAWVLSAVFVRFLEDNALIEPPQIAGPGDRLKLARDQHELYFRANPTETDREYLLHVFTEVGKLPGGREIFGKYNPAFEMPHWLSGDAAGEILKFFQKIDADSGELVHDFTDPEWDTRFLGDLYQDLSEAARKKYALLQTPEFVEEFILDRTLDPALDEFGLHAPAILNNDGDPITEPGFRMIDPACGSGHFLLGAFRRILDRWQRKEPGTNVRELVQRTLNSVNGVDINPYAIAIARFRLLVAALQACDVDRLKDAPAFSFSLTAGDSLLHGAPGGDQQLLGFDPLSHHYQVENIERLNQVLRPNTIHAVVANPPYITPKDRILNTAYREKFSACHGKYSLGVPFMQRLTDLVCANGYVGQITANSFMQREFGKKVIEEYIPTVDLTHVLDTKGAHIPGHTTPTVILFLRGRLPLSTSVRAALGIRGEPNFPTRPEEGVVWTSIAQNLDSAPFENEFISIVDKNRVEFHRHPWSIGGGGASDLKKRIDECSSRKLTDMADSIGITAFPMEDGIFLLDQEAARRRGLSAEHYRTMVVGDAIRDWTVGDCEVAAFPYTDNYEPIDEESKNPCIRHLWICRNVLSKSLMFGGKTKVETGLKWYEFGRLTSDKLRTPLSIIFSLISTHNHFYLDRGGNIFKNSVYVVKLPEGAGQDVHQFLVGLFNSSLACFWLKQVCYPKGTATGDVSTEKGKPEANRYDYGSKAILKFPVPKLESKLGKCVQALSSECETHAREMQLNSPEQAIRTWERNNGADSVEETLGDFAAKYDKAKRNLVAAQEELDWSVYALYGLADEGLLEDSVERVGIAPEDRAFNLMKSSPSTAQTAVDGNLIKRRLEAIKSSKELALIEQPLYKRLWLGRQGVYGSAKMTDSEWRSKALSEYLISRIESYMDFDGRMLFDGANSNQLDIELYSLARIADAARRDDRFQEVGALYTRDSAFDVLNLVTELVESESIPHLPILRYKASGLRKREEWEKTWALQRQEDAIDGRTELPTDDPSYLTKDQANRQKKQEVGDIPVPPKYKSSDFQKGHYWRLRGKLDVPKERWVSFPHCEGQDGTLMIAWAGYDHLQLARSISAHYVDIQERIGGRDDPRLVPLLASLIELLPWLKQWHNAIDPEFNMAMGDYFEGFVQEEARGLGMTLDEIRAWEPPKTTKRRAKRKKKTKTD